MDSVVSVKRHNKQVMIAKLVLGKRLVNVFSVYAPHSGKPDEEKESFWNGVFLKVGCVPQNKMVVAIRRINDVQRKLYR